MTFRTLKTFDLAIEAHLLKSKLESEGINCYIFDEHINNILPLHSLATSGIKLQVPIEEYEKALVLLEEIEDLPLIHNNEVLRCPNCQSEKLISNFRSFKGFMGILSIIMALLLSILPIHQNSVYKCKNCGNEFKKESEEK